MSALHLTPDGGRATRMFVLVLQNQSPAYTSFSPSFSLSLSFFSFLAFSLSYNALFQYISPQCLFLLTLLPFAFSSVLLSFTIVMIYAQKLISLSCCLLGFLLSFFVSINPSCDFFLEKRIKTDL